MFNHPSSLTTPTHLSEHPRIEDLKHLVEAKLAQTLHGVADECRSPAPGQSAEALLAGSQSESINHGLVLTRINLCMSVGLVLASFDRELLTGRGKLLTWYWFQRKGLCSHERRQECSLD